MNSRQEFKARVVDGEAFTFHQEHRRSQVNLCSHDGRSSSSSSSSSKWIASDTGASQFTSTRVKACVQMFSTHLHPSSSSSCFEEVIFCLSRRQRLSFLFSFNGLFCASRNQHRAFTERWGSLFSLQWEEGRDVSRSAFLVRATDVIRYLKERKRKNALTGGVEASEKEPDGKRLRKRDSLNERWDTVAWGRKGNYLRIRDAWQFSHIIVRNVLPTNNRDLLMPMNYA